MTILSQRAAPVCCWLPLTCSQVVSFSGHWKRMESQASRKWNKTGMVFWRIRNMWNRERLFPHLPPISNPLCHPALLPSWPHLCSGVNRVRALFHLENLSCIRMWFGGARLWLYGTRTSQLERGLPCPTCFASSLPWICWFSQSLPSSLFCFVSLWVPLEAFLFVSWCLESDTCSVEINLHCKLFAYLWRER